MRNNKTRLLFLPIAILLWLLGFTMAWAGFRKQQRTKRAEDDTTRKAESITVMSMIPQETEERQA
jgi:hypothetical protein